MEQGENKRQHLQFIQDVITRMSGNSFLLRGWSVTLITAIVGFALKSQGATYGTYLLFTAIFLVVVFWVLDAYYLSQERAYRSLYKEVSKKSEPSIDYSLDASGYVKGYNTWFSSMFSPIFITFYLPVLIGLLLVCSRFIHIEIYIK
ncbi:hypothetical protein H6804_00045 [Candidatus Nomurabacteria bacterium]|nr:hypothetical protein [Candidatus Nomurabacteria bacterium]MCB9826656.1 hypothetical protein [Candidatus Nomurabacteria bacterium]